MKPAILRTVAAMALSVASLLAFAAASGQAATGLDQLGRCSSAQAAAIQEDGKVIVLGSSGSFCSNEVTERQGVQPLLLRVNPDGSLDTSFGDEGVKMLPMQIVGEPVGVEIAPDGGAFSVFRDGWIVKTRPDGSLDPAFGSIGILRSRADATAFDVDGTGRIVILVNDNDGPAALRLLPNGWFDPTFGNGIEAEIAPTGAAPGSNVAPAVIAARGGEVLIGGRSGLRVFAMLLGADGQTDTAFAGGTGTAWVQPQEFGTANGPMTLGVDETSFSLSYGYVAYGFYGTNYRYKSVFDADGDLEVTTEFPFESPRSQVEYPDGRRLFSFASRGSRGLDSIAFQLGGSTDLLPSGAMTAYIGAGESVANGIALDPTGPGYAVGTAFSDPCTYLHADGPIEVEGCASSMVVYKTGDPAFGNDGFAAFPAIRCDHGTVGLRCSKPTEKIKAEVSSTLRFTWKKTRRPGLHGKIRVNPSAELMIVRVPKSLLPTGQRNRFWKRVQATQDGEKVPVSMVLPNGIYLNLDPDSASAVVLHITRGGLKPLRKKQKRYRFGVSVRGREANFDWQSNPVFVRGRPVR